MIRVRVAEKCLYSERLDSGSLEKLSFLLEKHTIARHEKELWIEQSGRRVSRPGNVAGP